MTPVSAGEDVERLWLATLQRALGRASHDVKDALNGVAVNLEVIRSRAARPDVLAGAVAPFADAAGHQLDRLITLLEAVLALGRVEREPVEVGVIVRRIATLCGASSSSADANVVVELGEVETARTSVRGDAVRLAVAAPLLALVAGEPGTAQATTVRCVVRGVAAGTEVRLVAAGRRALMPDAVAEVVRAAGVEWAEVVQDDAAGTGGLSLVFPHP